MKLEGDIGEINVIDRLVELGREGFTGAVRFENDGIIKIIYFTVGDVLSASTNDRTDSVDEILLRANKVTREHVKQALSRRKENETLGDALLGLGFITRKELSWARRVQVIGAIRSIAAWGGGTYNIVADYLPKREEGTLFALPQLIVELIVTDNDRAKVERALDGGNAVFARTADFDEQFSRLSLNEEAEQIATFVDGSRNAAEVSVESGKDAFNVYKLLLALSTIGVLTRREAGAPAEESFASVGVADASDQWSFDDAPEQPVSAWDTDEAVPMVQDAPELVHSAFSAEEPPAPEVPVAPVVSNPAPPPIAMPVPPSRLTPAEPQWGFDEAQIEAARRAAVPVSGRTEPPPPPMKDVVKKASKPDRWTWIIIFAVIVIGLGIAAPYAWNWWEARNAPPAPMVVKRKPKPRAVLSAAAAPPPPMAATTTTSTTATTTVAAATIPPVTTTTEPPPPAVKITPKSTPKTAGEAAGAPQKPASAPQRTVSTPNTTHIERNAAGVATMTNSGTAAPLPKVSVKEDAMRSHYDDMAQTFASQATGNFTVQFELVCQTSSVTKAIQAGGSNVWFIPIAYRGQNCYRVFWGHYPTKAEAQKALADVPSALRAGSTPSVVSVPKK
jgi:septal ring-binding cell division protein DamX